MGIGRQNHMHAQIHNIEYYNHTKEHPDPFGYSSLSGKTFLMKIVFAIFRHLHFGIRSYARGAAIWRKVWIYFCVFQLSVKSNFLPLLG